MDEAVRAILTDCQPFLALLRAGSGPLFRGSNRDGAKYFRDKVRRDRQPKNMRPDLHSAADEWFSRRFGVRYRGASLFCTGDRAGASRHGTVYLVFPVEGFQFCWSPKVTDLYEWSKAGGHLNLSPKEFADRLGGLDYQDWDLAAATASGCEVMVACNSYHAVMAESVAEERALLAELGIRPAEPDAAPDRGRDIVRGVPDSPTRIGN